ncbi:MAG: thioredoxin family protein [Flavobacterium sp.]|nr:thioredoxin family protein [Flavobacterium sp.]
MKKILFSAVLFLTISLANAQELTWHTDINKAIEISVKEKKPLMLFFTGSDWCGWCIRLQNEVFKKPEFAQWAKKKVVLVELDFPRKTKLDPKLEAQNNELQAIFQVRGYPSVWFVNPEKKKDKSINLQQLGKTGYVAGGPEKWLEAATSFVGK